jgi:hypothetical protein
MTQIWKRLLGNFSNMMGAPDGAGVFAAKVWREEFGCPNLPGMPEPILVHDNRDCQIARHIISVVAGYESVKSCSRGWPVASGAGALGSVKSLVQRQFFISGMSSKCSRM